MSSQNSRLHIPHLPEITITERHRPANEKKNGLSYFLKSSNDHISKNKSRCNYKLQKVPICQKTRHKHARNVSIERYNKTETCNRALDRRMVDETQQSIKEITPNYVKKSRCQHKIVSSSRISSKR